MMVLVYVLELHAQRVLISKNQVDQLIQLPLFKLGNVNYIATQKSLSLFPHLNQS